MKKEIDNIFAWFVRTITYNINKFDGDCMRLSQEVKNTKTSFDVNMFKFIDFDNITTEICDALHFGNWFPESEANKEIEIITEICKTHNIDISEYKDRIDLLNNTKNLRLIPNYLYDIIPDGTELVTINGNTIKFKHGYTSKDTRFGMLAYGFIVNK